MCSTMKRVECHIHCQVCDTFLLILTIGSNPMRLGLVDPVRAVAFSPGGKLLAAAGDSKVIILYETSSGEQVANLAGHAAWITSLDWSDTGEYLLSG